LRQARGPPPASGSGGARPGWGWNAGGPAGKVFVVAEESTPRSRDSQGRFLSQEETEEYSETTAQQPPAERTEISEPPPRDVEAQSEPPRDTSGPADDQANRTDAMGLDKRRQVVGQSYGPSVAKQATLYGLFLVVLVALVIGGKLLTDELDQPPEKQEDVAPWSAPDAPQIPTKPLQ
jgi:hypothetical protein